MIMIIIMVKMTLQIALCDEVIDIANDAYDNV